MSAAVLAAAVSLREALGGFEPGVLSGTDCLRLAEELAVTEKACGAARLLAAARAVESGAHREQGFKDAASWLAHQTGGTGAQGRQALDTAKRLEDCPGTRAALLAGDISVSQAAEITQAEADTPGAERALLPVARHGDLSRLRERAREHRQAHTPVEGLHRQQHEARFFRHWRDRLGMVCFAGAMPPETGLPFVRRVELATLRVRRGVERDRRERWEAYSADALAGLTAGGHESKRSDRAELVIVCDLHAWRRGHAHEEEVCHIVDGGPIPVEVAKELAEDAFLSAVLHDGVAIQTVKRFGRYQPAELRTALDLGPVPEFTGRQCADCSQRWGLQYDMWIRWPTAVRPATPTSRPAAGPATRPRPNETARPDCSAPTPPAHPTAQQRPDSVRSEPKAVRAPEHLGARGAGARPGSATVPRWAR